MGRAGLVNVGGVRREVTFKLPETSYNIVPTPVEAPAKSMSGENTRDHGICQYSLRQEEKACENTIANWRVGRH